MPEFNARKFEQSLIFTCRNCAKKTSYSSASKGCSRCGHHLFKVADRTGTPAAWDRDRMDKDPYLRQKQKAVGTNDGAGYKLTTPFDEGDFSGGGGGRFRGSPAGPGPTDFSQDSSEYDQQQKNNLPSQDLDMDHPPYEGTPSEGWFADPSSPLSSTQMMNQKMDHPEAASINQQLSRQRVVDDKSSRKRLDDSVFGRTVSKLRGVSR